MTAERPSRYDPKRWHAVALDEDGFVLSFHDLEAWYDEPDENTEPEEIKIVTGTAVPLSQSSRVDDFHRSPGSYRTLDVIAEWDVSGYEPEEVETIFSRATRIVNQTSP